MKQPKSLAPEAIPYVAAFAIEDHVEFAITELELRPNGEWHLSPKGPISEAHYKEPISNDADYFAGVRMHMHAAMSQLYHYAKGNFGDDQIVGLFDSIRLMAVSIPGVIDEGRRVLQLPLWSWPTESRVTWQFGQRRILDFDVPLEIFEILIEIAKENGDGKFAAHIREGRSDFMNLVEVYNDCAAAAAAELYHRDASGASSKGTFVFVKAHDGINVGAIEEGLDRKPTHNAELGHIYPNRHADDDAADFPGVCHFHQDCAEGLVSARSLYERAISAEPGSVFAPWRKIVEDEKIAPGQDGRLCRFLLGSSVDDSVGGRTEATQLVGFYIAQLVHIIALFPLSPTQIIIGGRMATKDVLFWTREYVKDFWRGYPLRPQFQPDNIARYIVRSEVPDPRERELQGALVIARTRANAKLRQSKLRAVADGRR